MRVETWTAIQATAVILVFEVFRVSTDNPDCVTAVTPGSGESFWITDERYIFLKNIFQLTNTVPDFVVQLIVLDSPIGKITGPLGWIVTVVHYTSHYIHYTTLVLI